MREETVHVDNRTYIPLQELAGLFGSHHRAYYFYWYNNRWNYSEGGEAYFSSYLRVLSIKKPHD